MKKYNIPVFDVKVKKAEEIFVKAYKKAKKEGDEGKKDKALKDLKAYREKTKKDN